MLATLVCDILNKCQKSWIGKSVKKLTKFLEQVEVNHMVTRGLLKHWSLGLVDTCRGLLKQVSTSPSGIYCSVNSKLHKTFEI